MQERVVEQHREDLLRRHRRADRHHAAAERFRQTQDVGLNVLMLAGEHLAGAAHTGLHFVEDQQGAKLVAQFAHRRQIPRRRQDHPPFALNRLKDHRCDVVTGFLALAQHGAHGVDIAERHMAEARQQRHKRFAESRLGGGRQRPQRFAVEGAAGGDEGEFTSRRLIGFRQLDGRLYRFGTAVAEETVL